MSVAFSYPDFTARYPEFASVNATVLGEYFADATDILDNQSPFAIQDLTKRERLLNLLTAHIASLAASAAAGTAFAGPVSSATEGSVTVSASIRVPTGADWFYTTPYGRQFWQATIGLRSARYIASPVRRATRWP